MPAKQARFVKPSGRGRWKEEDKGAFEQFLLLRALTIDWTMASGVTEWTSEYKLPCRCSKCECTCSALINNLRQGHGIACWCSGKMPHADRQYYDRCIAQPYTPRGADTPLYARLHDGSTETPTWEVWRQAAREGSHAKLSCLCLKCGCTGSTQLSGLQQGWGTACLCSGVMRLADPQYYDRCIAKPYTPPNADKPWYAQLHDGSLKLHDGSLKTRKEMWQQQAAREGGSKAQLSCLCLTCMTTASAAITSLQRGQGIACLCTMWKGQRAARESLNCTFPGLELVDEKVCRIGGRVRKFDIAHEASKTLWEIDGRQHFEDITFFDKTPFEERVAADLQKELWAETNGYLVVRVLSADAYAGKSATWDFLRSTFQDRLDGKLPGGRVVTQPDTPEYDTGAYAEARSQEGLRCRSSDAAPMTHRYLGPMTHRYPPVDDSSLSDAAPMTHRYPAPRTETHISTQSPEQT